MCYQQKETSEEQNTYNSTSDLREIIYEQKCGLLFLYLEVEIICGFQFEVIGF